MDEIEPCESAGKFENEQALAAKVSNSVAGPSDDQPGPSEPPKEVQEKKNRRRSSIGGEILNAFLKIESQDTMSPVEVRRARPRRAAQMKVAPAPVAPAPVQRQKPIRYSFDIGERVETKSCLKPTTAPILLHKGLQIPKKSVAQRAAQKIVEKYKNAGNSDKTPIGKREGLLKFHNICTIRVISPRPEYNPDHLEMPHSDDEEEPALNPNRERLSTVALRLTPTSESKLEELQEHDVVQFNAEMVFGDRDEKSPISDDPETAVEPSETESDKTDVNKDHNAEVEKQVKKRTRRKSLIVGGASPMKIEKPRFDDTSDDQIPEPKTRNRRSTRLTVSSTEKTSVSTSESDSLEILEEVNLSKKRELVVESKSESSSEPAPKKNRRRSQAPLLVAAQSAQAEQSDQSTEKRRRKSVVIKSEEPPKIHDFFTSKTSKPKKVVEENKPIKVAAAVSKRRRSTRFVLKPDEIPEEVPECVTDSASISTTSEKSERISASPEESKREVIVENASLETKPPAPEPKKLAPMFMISPKTSQSEVLKKKGIPFVEQQYEDFQPPGDSKQEVTVENAPERIMAPMLTPKAPQLEFVKKNEIASTPKLFSLFSPKPKPKVTDVVDLTMSPIASTSSTTSTSEHEKPKKMGIKREERWGDYHPEFYHYLSNMTVECNDKASECTTHEEAIFAATREFDTEIFKLPVSSESLKLKTINDPKEKDNVDPSLTASNSKEHLKKIASIEGQCPLLVTPSSMADLNEGGDEEECIVRWLRKWKKRVRKVAEQEMKKNKTSKKSKRRDSEDEYEVEDGDPDELENPLVLIGPTGVGKSTLIRVLAKLENMRIISMGPETDRTGAEIKKKLQEAMKSHRVDQNTSHQLTSFFANGVKQGGYTRKEKTVLDKEYAQSLIVFEHVDVFFDSWDRHGVTALLEVVNEAVVPVIFTSETLDWPRSSGVVELRRPPLEVIMDRKKEKTWKCVQKLIYSCRNVFIDDSTMNLLSQSVNHDLRGLLQQANFYALSPSRPLPLTSRELISDGFSTHWELEMSRKPRKCAKNSDRAQELYRQYSKETDIDGLFHFDSKPVVMNYSEQVDTAYEALRGRYSRRQISEDVLPLLVPIDRVERRKMARIRRHLHLFKEHSDQYPIDGEALMQAVSSSAFKN